MIFDIALFRELYPQFNSLPDSVLTFYYQNACMISGLDADNKQFKEEERINLLMMLTCHLATLAMRGTAGAMTSAKEGEVSVTFASYATGKNSDWYMSTPCGAAYYQAIKAISYGGLWFNGRKGL